MGFVAVKAKELRYAVGLSASGELTDENGVVLEAPPEWTPEHLLLAALVGCSLKSLRFHAKRRNIEVRSTSGRARTLVTRRDTDDRYAMVDTEVELAAEVDPEPDPPGLATLLELAERDCFIGSSLIVKPRYRWTVNGWTGGS
ncbi:MAG TPA: OsmC family protein [Gaiellaceae bacterium]|nr:OsmC family protein [Gaiellaceae bacterium]